MSVHTHTDIYVWTGLASYRGTIYRLTIETKGPRWENEMKKAVRSVGAHVQSLNKPNLLPVEKRFDSFLMMSQHNAAFHVTLSPDHMLTTGALRRRSESLYVTASFKAVREKNGELQTPSAKLMKGAASHHPQTIPLKRHYRKI